MFKPPILITYIKHAPAAISPCRMYHNRAIRVGDEFGQWRRYGLGMVCLHRGDLARVGGFSTTIRGWGEEDVDLYERIVRSKVEVRRVHACHILASHYIGNIG